MAPLATLSAHFREEAAFFGPPLLRARVQWWEGAQIEPGIIVTARSLTTPMVKRPEIIAQESLPALFMLLSFLRSVVPQ